MRGCLLVPFLIHHAAITSQCHHGPVDVESTIQNGENMLPAICVTCLLQHMFLSFKNWPTRLGTAMYNGVHPEQPCKAGLVLLVVHRPLRLHLICWVL